MPTSVLNGFPQFSSFFIEPVVFYNDQNGNDTLKFEHDLFLFPNPCSGDIVKLVMPDKFSGKFTVNIYSLGGKFIRSDNYFSPLRKTEEIRLENLQPGIYLIDIKSNDFNKIVRLIKN